MLPDGFRNGHAHSLYKLSEKLKGKLGKPGKFPGSSTGNVAVALYIWLYHFLGGACAKLMAPPAAGDRDGILRSANIRFQARRAAADYARELERICKLPVDAATVELDVLRSPL
eukprot:1904483-Prymnesium_polylepis.1